MSLALSDLPTRHQPSPKSFLATALQAALLGAPPRQNEDAHLARLAALAANPVPGQERREGETETETKQSPVFLSLLCAHALCSCFVLCALCSVLMLCAYRVFWSPLTKHEACARSRWPVLRKAKMGRQTLLLTKIGSFCRARPSTKHKAYAQSSQF
jgi:hypothetical protein